MTLYLTPRRFSMLHMTKQHSALLQAGCQVGDADKGCTVAAPVHHMQV